MAPTVGHGHEEILVKDLPVPDALPGLHQNVVADDQVGRQIQDQPEPARHRDQGQPSQHHGGYHDPPQHFFLLLVHVGASNGISNDCLFVESFVPWIRPGRRLPGAGARPAERRPYR